MLSMVFIATSLDGFIARKDGNIDWLVKFENPAGEDYGFSEFMSTIDAIVMGRGTFEKVVSFPTWPYNKEVFVLSTTLNDIPPLLKGRASVLSKAPRELLDFLSKRGYRNIYVDGGQTIQNFLNEDLIDHLTITRIPVLIGSGIPLFGNLDRDLNFKHVETTVYPNGLVKSHYERVRE